jgi:hypothetical protein
MPAGNTLIRPPAKVIEKVTAQACIAIAQKIQRSLSLSGDTTGSDAARQVAHLIQQELLEPLAAAKEKSSG